MKHIHRFFVLQPLTAGERVLLGEEDSFHAARVLRLKEGDAIELADADGRVFEAEIAGIGDGKGVVEARTREELAPVGEAGGLNAPGLTVAQALPGGRKMDLIAEKLSEIGAARLVPVISQKSVAGEGRGWSRKTERWRRVARAAATQSKRSRIMEVEVPVPLGDWLEDFEGRPLVLATEVKGKPLGEAVMEVANEGGTDRDLTLVIGPEAGFAGEEIDILTQHEAVFVSLGQLVLRTETAALVAAAVVMHRLGMIG